MGWLLLLPVILIGSVAVVSLVFVRLSTVRITNAGVAFRNYPQDTKTIPLASVDRFVPAKRVGLFSFLRPATAVLILTDGSRVAVRALGDAEAGYGVDALNARVTVLRPGT